MSKKKVFIELINQMIEEFPIMNNVATDDLDNPSFILIANTENFEAFTQLMSLASIMESTLEDEMSGLDDLDNVIHGDHLKLIEFNPEDDEGNGNLH